MGALVLNGQTIGDSCLFPIENYVPQKQAGPIGGVWEQRATFDNRSPSFFFRIEFVCIKVEGMSCPEDVKKYVAQLRPTVGEGPFAGTFTGESITRDYTNLRWASTPRITKDQKRWEQFTIELQTEDDPAAGSP